MEQGEHTLAFEEIKVKRLWRHRPHSPASHPPSLLCLEGQTQRHVTLGHELRVTGPGASFIAGGAGRPFRRQDPSLSSLLPSSPVPLGRASSSCWEGNDKHAQSRMALPLFTAQEARPRFCKTTRSHEKRPSPGRAPLAGSRTKMISPSASSVTPPGKTADTSEDERPKSRDCPLRFPSSTSFPPMAP